MAETAHTDVLDRVLDPFTRCLTREVARRIANLRADSATQTRVDELADKANEGQLNRRRAGRIRRVPIRLPFRHRPADQGAHAAETRRRGLGTEDGR